MYKYAVAKILHLKFCQIRNYIVTYVHITYLIDMTDFLTF